MHDRLNSPESLNHQREDRIVTYDFLGNRWVTNRRTCRLWCIVGWIALAVVFAAAVLVPPN